MTQKEQIRTSNIVINTNSIFDVLNFYKDVLMLDLIFTNKETYIFRVSDNQFIELKPSKKDKINVDSFYGFRHICIEVVDIDEMLIKLQANGLINYTNICKGMDGSYQFWLHDPEDNKY